MVKVMIQLLHYLMPWFPSVHSTVVGIRLLDIPDEMLDAVVKGRGPI